MFRTHIFSIAIAIVGGVSLIATPARAQIINTGNHPGWSGEVQPTLPHVVGGKIDAGGKVVPTEGQAGIPICFGDGTGTKCPTGHMGLPGHGCDNSAFTGGGLLLAIGNAKVSKDTMKMQVSGLPADSTALFMQGRELAKTGITFGDGIVCLQGAVTNIGIKRAAYGAAEYPQYGDVPICDKGQVPPFGTTVYYQVLYRDEGASSNPKQHFNLSNAWMTVWAP